MMNCKDDKNYEMQRVMASPLVAYPLENWIDFGKTIFYQGLSLSMDKTHKITETCKTACRSNSSDAIVSAADAQITTLIVRGRNGNPLT